MREGWLIAAVCLLPSAALAQSQPAQNGMADCKASIMGALTGTSAPPMPAANPPMPMPGFTPDAPMATGMAPPAAKTGDVGAKSAVQDRCMDKVLPAEQTEMDTKK